MSEKLKILFVCVGNTCRSQMAEGFANKYGTDRVDVRSGGTHAFGNVNKYTIDSMAEIGIDISDHTSDQLKGEMLEWADIIVTTGCCRANELCAVDINRDLGKITYDWPIADPLGRDEDYFRVVRDDIEKRVKELLKEHLDG